MILGILARVTDDSDRRRWALEEGEGLLQTDSVSHNFLCYYEAAIAVSPGTGARRMTTRPNWIATLATNPCP